MDGGMEEAGGEKEGGEEKERGEGGRGGEREKERKYESPSYCFSPLWRMPTNA